MSAPSDATRARADRFEIVCDVRAETAAYSLGLSVEDVPELVAALAKSGRRATGYAIEAFLVILSEVGDPAWARDLVFDSEASRCVVRCGRRGPLRRLAERLTRVVSARVIALRDYATSERRESYCPNPSIGGLRDLTLPPEHDVAREDRIGVPFRSRGAPKVPELLLKAAKIGSRRTFEKTAKCVSVQADSSQVVVSPHKNEMPGFTVIAGSEIGVPIDADASVLGREIQRALERCT